MSDYKKLDVSPAVHDGEWRVRVGIDVLAEEPGMHAAVVFLSATEAKDLQQRLFHLALEISEREGGPARVETVEQLRAQLSKERQKRIELVSKVAPKEKLEAAKSAVRSALMGYELLKLDEVKASGPTSTELKAALAWLEEFKA